MSDQTPDTPTDPTGLGVVWEYDAYTISGPAGDAGLLAGMNKLGLEGWEVLAFKPVSPVTPSLSGQRQKWQLYVKRPERRVRAASVADLNAVTAELTIAG